MLAKILNYVKITLLSLSVLFVLMYLWEVIPLTSLINYSLFLLIAIVVATLGTALINIIENPKSGINFGIGLALLIIFFFIGYGVSTQAIDPKSNEVIPGSRIAEAGIILFQIIFVIALLVGAISVFKRLKSLL